MDQGKICDPNRAAGRGPRSPFGALVHTAELAEGFPAQQLLLSVGNGMSWKMIPSAMSAQRDDKTLVLPHLKNLLVDWQSDSREDVRSKPKHFLNASIILREL